MKIAFVSLKLVLLQVASVIHIFAQSPTSQSIQDFSGLCIPYIPGRSPALRRWSSFTFEGTKDTLPNIDTREESWDVVSLSSNAILKKDSQKRQIHRALLNEYKFEAQLNADRQSIGVLIPEPTSLDFSLRRFNPNNPKDQKKLGHQELMAF